jgi:hypothetical protein
VSLGDWLLGNGAILRVIDNEDVPMPSQWDGRASRLESVNDSLKDSDVFVVGAGFVLQDTNIDFKHLSRSNSPLLVLDAGRRWPSLELIENVEYVFVGKERNPNE